MGLCREISAMEPFGISNPVPTFVLREARVLRIIPMSGGKHTRLVVEKDGIEMSAVRFGVGAQELGCEVGDAVDLLFQINVAVGLIIPFLFFMAVMAFMYNYAAYPVIKKFMIDPPVVKESSEG